MKIDLMYMFLMVGETAAPANTHANMGKHENSTKKGPAAAGLEPRPFCYGATVLTTDPLRHIAISLETDRF